MIVALRMKFIFLLHGVAIGLPWNALLVATEYYRERVLTIPLSTLMSYLSVAYLGANLLGFAWLNRPGYEPTPARERRAIVLFYALNVALFAGLCGSTRTQLADNGLAGLVLSVGVLLGLTSALFQDTILSRAAREGPAFAQIYLVGFALSAVAISAFSAGVAPSMDATTSGSLVFGSSSLALVVASLMIMAGECRRRMMFRKTRIGNEYVQESEADEATEAIEESRIIAGKNALWAPIMVVALSLCGTLSVFPGIVSAIQPLDEISSPGDFTLLLFLYFNLGDAAGRILSSHLVSGFSTEVLVVFTLLRTMSLGLFAITNLPGVKTEHMLSDDAVCQLVFLQALAGGLLLAGGAMRAPLATPEKPERGAKLVAVTIAISLVIGALLGNLIVQIAF